MLNALIYTRVSTDDQAKEERHSLATQKRLCKRAISESGEYKLAEDGVFSDPGRSATNMKRPGLQNMLVRVEEDKTIRAIFVQDTDRIARNLMDHVTIKYTLEKNKVKLISVSQPSINNSPEGNFTDSVIAAVNQLQSQITARKTFKSLEEKFNDGWWPTLAPIGYKNDGMPENEKKRIIVLDKERAPYIKMAYKMYSTGDYSIAEIREKLYKKGFVTAAGKMISLSKMARILNNHFYYGEMRWQDLIGPGKHEPLISKELFDKCQRVSVSHRNRGCRRRKHNFILRGFLYCMSCGRRFTAEHHPKKNKSYYHCTRNTGTAARCNDKYVEVKNLERQVEEKFKDIQFTKAFIEKVINKVRVIHEEQKGNVNDQKKTLKITRENLEKKLSVAEDKLFSGVISDEVFTRTKNRYENLIENLNDEESKLNRSRSLNFDVIQNVLELIRNMGKSYKKASPELKRLYLNLFWEHFKVQDKKIVEAQSTPIVIALQQLSSIRFNTKQKPADTRVFDIDVPNNKVILSTVLGDRRDLNPRPPVPQTGALTN